VHPALTRAIANNPNQATEDSDLIILGDTIPESAHGSAAWWPTPCRKKFGLNFSTGSVVKDTYHFGCLPRDAFTDVHYDFRITRWRTKAQKRLRYHSSPITDFGISCGSVNVKNQDKLNYFSPSDFTFMNGQDPDDHYWIYFTTISGEEVTLDCSMSTYWRASKALEHTLKSSRWKTFPLYPLVDYCDDPGDLDGRNDDWQKQMKKWNRLRKEGKITDEDYVKAFHTYAWKT
jgi:hypothetical protein